MVLTLPLISISFSFFPKPLRTVPSAPTTIGAMIYFHHHYYYFTLVKFFAPALTGGFSLESKWQQVSLASHYYELSVSKPCCLQQYVSRIKGISYLMHMILCMGSHVLRWGESLLPHFVCLEGQIKRDLKEFHFR